MLKKQIISTPIGNMSLVASSKGLVGAWFEDQKHFEKGIAEMICFQSDDIFEETSQLFAEYFLGQCPDFRHLRLDMRGTAFQVKVWELLQEIPFGETVSYGQIAKQLNVYSSQAVGGAVGRNPFSIIVPCHRVVGSKGQLTGYAGGLDKKIWLLKHENPQFEVKK